MNERDGEFMELWFDDYVRDREYVRGHVDMETAREAIRTHNGLADHEELILVHKYARWEFPDDMEKNQLGFDMTFRPYEEPGRGRFKVTLVRRSENRTEP